MGATITEKYSQIHDNIILTHTRWLPHENRTKIDCGDVLRDFDNYLRQHVLRTHSSRFIAHVVDVREPVTTRFAPLIPERDERFPINYDLRYDRPRCLGRLSPVARNSRKSKAQGKALAKTKHQMATATERPGSGRDHVRGSQIMDGQPHRYSLLLAGDDPRLRLLYVTSAAILLPTTTTQKK